MTCYDTPDHIAAELRARYNLAVEKYGYRSLYECYIQPSAAKERAWQNIVTECGTAHGYTPVVISYNHQFFTTGFVFPDPNTGVAMLRVDTPNNTYMMEY